MGLQSKLFHLLGVQHKKMKEKKSDSFFLFRKGGSRYSFVGDKKKRNSELSNVQIQRLSWSSFPLNKIPLPADTCAPVDVPSRRTKSSENLKAKQQAASKGLHNKLAKAKSPSATIRQLFSHGSSSSVVSTPTPSSSSNSSASSSPRVRQSWCSGVTHILERCGGEAGTLESPGYVDDIFQEDSPSRRGSTDDEVLLVHDAPLMRGAVVGAGLPSNKYLVDLARSGFSVGSLLEEDEDDIMITPKIICAHKKTPDLVRKSRLQIRQELEYIKELGMLPEELEPDMLSAPEIRGEEDTLNEGKHNFYVSSDLNLNALRGYKTTTDGEMSQKEQNGRVNRNLPADKLSTPVHHVKVVLNDKEYCQHERTGSFSNSLPTLAKEDIKFDSQSVNIPIGPNSSPEDKTSVTLSSVSVDLNPGLIYPGKEDDPYVMSRESSLRNILVSEYDSEDLSNNEEDNESSSFEKRLEDDLEKLVEKEDGIEGRLNDFEPSGGALSDEEERVQFRRKVRPTLYIDIEKARSSKTLSNERLLRRIREDGYDSARSSRSSPRSPRSPAIDIDDLFKQRQKRLAESPVDNLTQVKDLAQRLRLSTKTPPHVDWVNGLANSTDARQLAQALSPQVVEDSEGVFHLEESTKELTDLQRENNLSKALLWIKEELVKMKSQDQDLARQLVHLQLEMQRLRLVCSCTQHEALLEEVTCEEEELKALMTSVDLIDLPNNLRECAFSSLRDIGVTKMNITSRRFSLR